MDILIAIIKSLAVTFIVVYPIAFIINGIDKSIKLGKAYDENFKEWEIELDRYVKALGEGDEEMAEYHSKNMKRLDEQFTDM